MAKVVDSKYLERFAWEYKNGKRTGRSLADVTVQLKDRILKVTFRNNNGDLITSTNYLTFCLFKNRIMFNETDDRGYKVFKSGSSHIKYLSATITPEKVEKYKEFEGDYKLKLDEFYGIYYIEKKDGAINE